MSSPFAYYVVHLTSEDGTVFLSLDDVITEISDRRRPYSKVCAVHHVQDGRVTDISEDAARAWLAEIDPANTDNIPDFVRNTLPAIVAEMEADASDDADWQRQRSADYHAGVL